jgi:hypothetical protein
LFAASPKTFILRFNGSTWAVDGIAPQGGGIPQIEAVSCVGVRPCEATGNLDAGLTFNPVVVDTFDRTWHAANTSQINGSNDLAAVSCTTGHTCMAVGIHYAAPVGRTLTVRGP